MNIAMWMLAGGVAGWMGFAYLRFNAERGMLISVIIGAAGGFIGGNVLAPMFGAAAAVPGDFSPAALFIALAAAAGCLYVGNLVQDRFGV